jgi:hypothetical protein
LNHSHACRIGVTGVDVTPRERLNAHRIASSTASRSLFYGDPCVVTQQIDLQRSDAVERNRKRAVQAEATLRLRQRLEAPVQERLGGAACPGRAVGFSRRRSRGVHEQTGERAVDAVSDEAAHAP